MSSLNQLLTEECLEEGFPWSGGVNVDEVPEFQSHFEFFKDWLSQGHHGEMGYLERGKDRRGEVALVFPKVKSVYCVAFPYPAQTHGKSELTEGVQYAKYLYGGDYHDWIKERLERTLKRVTLKHTGEKLEWKICVDTSAVLERSWAYFSGLGWIGKNAMMIHPKHGSYFLVGVALLSQKLESSAKTLPNYCGSCTRCIDACPTQALPEPGVLDATRCMSYWTIEKRGDIQLSEVDRKSLGNWVAGCDICQDVCPFNLKSKKYSQENGIPEYFNSQPSSWETLLAETEEEYLQRVSVSALNRVKWENFQRNLAWVLANTLESNPDWAFLEADSLRLAIQSKIEFAKTDWLKNQWIQVQDTFEKITSNVDESLSQTHTPGFL